MVVYPVNPKALDRARDRFRMSRSKSDAFDAYVLAEFVRTDHAHLRALQPDSGKPKSLKCSLGIRPTGAPENATSQSAHDHAQRVLSSALEVFGDLETKIALDFLKPYPTPQALSNLKRRAGIALPHATSLEKQRCEELWEKLKKPQLAVPEHVVRAKAQLSRRLWISLGHRSKR